MGYSNEVAFALAQMEFSSDEQHDAFLDSFVTRWGGLTPAAFIRALREGIAEEPEWSRHFSLFALGASPDPDNRAIAGSYLESRDPKERWVAAIALGAHMAADPRVFGALQQMLTEFLPDVLRAAPWGGGDRFFEMYRGWAPRLLGESANRTSVPSLRSALVAVARLLGQDASASDADMPHNDTHVSTNYWEQYQDNIVYALGRLTAFGALTGLPVSPSRLYLWAVHLTLGAMHGRFVMRDLLQWRAANSLPQEVLNELANEFGWDEAQQRIVSTNYLSTKLSRLFVAIGAFGS
jgi:hypothetical protein